MKLDKLASPVFFFFKCSDVEEEDRRLSSDCVEILPQILFLLKGERERVCVWVRERERERERNEHNDCVGGCLPDGREKQ